MLFGVYLSGVVIAVASNVVAGQAWTAGAWIGVFMGLFSFGANAAMYRGYAVGKASLIAILASLSPVVAAGAAYAVLGEKLSGLQSLSFGIIIIGILMIRYSNDISLSNLQGAGWGVLTMVLFGMTDATTKMATLHGAQTMPALTVMYATGSVLFFLAWMRGTWMRRGQDTSANAALASVSAAAKEWAAAAEIGDGRTKSASRDAADNAEPAPVVAERPAVTADLRPVPWSFSRTLLWGMFVGLTNIFGMMFALPAFRVGVTGLVSAVMAMSVLFVLLYARIILKEKFSRLEIGGILCALLGMIAMRLVS